MAASNTSPRAFLGIALIVVGCLLALFGAGTLLFTAYLVAVERSVSLGHIPALIPAVQGLVCLVFGLLAFRKGRKIYGSVAS
jgi:hypothetical protein